MTDRGSPPLVATERAYVTVQSISHYSLKFAKNRYTVEVQPPFVPGILIPVNLEVVENGFNSKSKLEYSIEPENPYFEINGHNGEIKTVSNLIPHQKKTTLNVKVSNKETSSYTIVKIVLLEPYSGDLKLKEIYVEENLKKVCQYSFITHLFLFELNKDLVLTSCVCELYYFSTYNRDFKFSGKSIVYIGKYSQHSRC